MESSIRHCILEVPHNDQREVGVERPECGSKCDDGLFKEHWRVCGVCCILGCGDGVVAMTTLKGVDTEYGGVIQVGTLKDEGVHANIVAGALTDKSCM